MIDKTNWETAQGLLPEPVLEWVKKGDFVLNIDEPDFELPDCLPPFQNDTVKIRSAIPWLKPFTLERATKKTQAPERQQEEE